MSETTGTDAGAPAEAGTDPDAGGEPEDPTEPATEAEPRRTSLRRQLALLRYVRPYWRALLVVLATMLAEVGLQLLRPWPLKILVDNVLGGHPIPSGLSTVTGATTPSGLLPWVVVAEVVIFLGGTAAGMAAPTTTETMAQRLGASMR